MGVILSSRVKDDGKIVLEIAVDYEESIQLKGHMNNVHIFSENVADVKMTISHRGKDDSTKYFIIPKALREGLNLNAKTTCQRIDTKMKTIFVYVMDNTGI